MSRPALKDDSHTSLALPPNILEILLYSDITLKWLKSTQKLFIYFIRNVNVTSRVYYFILFRLLTYQVKIHADERVTQLHKKKSVEKMQLRKQ